MMVPQAQYIWKFDGIYMNHISNVNTEREEENKSKR